ncbi:hypothetical protein LINPERPRIM_LOCUS32648 [Linum perenne]
MLLKILAYSNSAQDNAEDFQHSTAIVSKYFGIILKVVIGMLRVVIVPPNISEVPPQILNDPKYYPYFKHYKKNAIWRRSDTRFRFGHRPTPKYIASVGKTDANFGDAKF